MMKIILFILLSLTSYLYSQESILGFYESSLDIYWTGHTRLYLQLKSDSTYTFGFWDDTQREKTDGVWSRENDTLFLKPSKIPPKIVIDYKYDRKNKSPFNEFIVVGINDSAIGKVNYKLYVHSTLHQDSTLNGYLKYDIQDCDSIQFSVLNKWFTIIPNKSNNPSWIKVFIDTDNVDLLDRFIPNRKLCIKDNEIKFTLNREYYFKKVNIIDWFD